MNEGLATCDEIQQLFTETKLTFGLDGLASRTKFPTIFLFLFFKNFFVYLHQPTNTCGTIVEQLLRYIESFSTYNDKVFRVIMDALGYDAEGYYIKDSKYWSTSACCYGDIIHMLTCLDVMRVKVGKLFYYMSWDSDFCKYSIIQL